MTMNFNLPARHTAKQRGLSLIELLVAITISMAALIVMLNLFRNTEGSRRITATTADAQINMQIALASLERDAKNAGLGLTNTACKKIEYFDGSAKQTNSDLRLPVHIGSPDATGNVPITFTGATNSLAVFKSKLATNGWQRAGGSSSTIDVESVAGFAEICAPDATKACTAASPLIMIQQTDSCVIAKLTDVDKDTGRLTLASSGAYRVTPGDFPPGTNYPVNSGEVSALGNFESYKYWVGGSASNGVSESLQSLIVHSMLPTESADDYLLRNIVGFYAEYGVGSNGILNGFKTKATIGSITDLSSIMAIRIAIIAKTEQFDKEAYDAGTPVTKTIKWWESKTDSTNTTYVKTLSGNDQYYRYRVLEAVIPLRNSIWSQ